MVTHGDQTDLLSDLSEMDFVRHLLADLHDNLPEKVSRFRMLTDLGGQMGPSGTMIFGGHAAMRAERAHDRIVQDRAGLEINLFR